MKSLLKMVRIHILSGLVMLPLFFLVSDLAAQKMPQITARFSNPRFDKESGNYYLDVELNSTASNEKLFGMNVRFFYDATKLEFITFDQFKPGYGFVGEKPSVFVGSEQSGTQLFNLNGPAAYVNGAIQMIDAEFPLEITTGNWVKAFRAAFKVPSIYQREENFCPSVFWDLKPKAGTGGFLPGSDGLLITVTENDATSRAVSTPSITRGEFINWAQNQTESAPYGNHIQNHCISVAESVASEEPVSIGEKGYTLYQNTPNPFEDRTRIEFILPAPQEASIKFYDGSGKILDEIKGEYKAGKNAVYLDKKPWMEQAGIFIYRLETEGFQSEPLKMSMVSK